MDKCLFCQKMTVFREAETRKYFCTPICQTEYYYPLNGKFSERKRPDALTDENVWGDILKYDLLKDKDPSDPSLTKKRSDILSGLNREIRRHENFQVLWESVLSFNYETKNSDKLRKWLGVIEHQFSQIPRPGAKFDSREVFEKTFSDYQKNLEIYKEEVGNVLEEIIVSQNIMERASAKYESFAKLLGQGSNIVGYDISKVEITLRDIPVKIKSLEELRSEFVDDMESSSSDLLSTTTTSESDDDDDISQELVVEEEEGTEEIEVERDPEVVEGMTQAQWDVFEEIENHIIDHEKTFKIQCIRPVHDYLANCDIVMHLPLYTVLKKVVEKKDPFIRNFFEVGTSGGYEGEEERKEWEHKIFESEEYDKFPPHEKVKYATINWAKSRKGVSQVFGFSYGKSYLVFNDNIKKRVTYARFDSSYPTVKGKSDLGTNKHMCKISRQFTAEERKWMEFYQPSSKGNPNMNTIKDYVEVQIHGELVFARDVSRIMLAEHMNNDEVRQLLKDYFKIIGREVPFEFI